MDVMTEKKQWELCPYCGVETRPSPAHVKKLTDEGLSQEEAEAYCRQHVYMRCPQEHIAPFKEMVPLEALEHAAYYYGKCRNARVARWDAERRLFTYMREKFRNVFPENIGYWVEGHRFDEFQPYGKLDNPPFEIPMGEGYGLPEE